MLNNLIYYSLFYKKYANTLEGSLLLANLFNKIFFFKLVKSSSVAHFNPIVYIILLSGIFYNIKIKFVSSY